MLGQGWVVSSSSFVACVCSSFEIEIVLEPSDSVLKLLQMGLFRRGFLSVCSCFCLMRSNDWPFLKVGAPYISKGYGALTVQLY